jgi:hypothetical protein
LKGFIFILEVEGFCSCSLNGWRLLFFLLKVEGFFFSLKKVEGFCFCSWRLKVFVIALKEVEGFCFCFWRLKVFVFALREVEYFCFRFWMLKVFTYGFGCWNFLLLLLDIEGCYFWYFYVIGPNFHYVSIHQHQNYVYKVRFFQKYLKL